MKKVLVKTPSCIYEAEIANVDGEERVCTVSKSNGNRYLYWCEVPEKVQKSLKKRFPIDLFDVRTLNYTLGLCK